MVASYMEEVLTKSSHQFCLQEELGFALGFVVFLNTSFNLVVMMRSSEEVALRIAKRGQADCRTLRLLAQNGTAQHPLSVCFRIPQPQTGV